MKTRNARNKSCFLKGGLWILLIFSVLLPASGFSQSWKWIAYGDTRSSDSRHREVLQAIVKNTPDYKFMINVGDVVAKGMNKSDWEIWQKACDDVLGGTGQNQSPPRYMSTPGNHDKIKDPTGLQNWNEFLSGQAQQFGHEGKYFVFDYENARFIILDSGPSSMTGEQYTMMMEAIQNNPKTWLFVFWHYPIFDFGPKSYEGEIHDTWGIPLYQHGCDMIFNGHAHYYARSKKLELNGDSKPPLDPVKGTVQVVTGNGGASSYSFSSNYGGNGYMLEAKTEEYGYTELTVDGESLRLRHILADGTVFDEQYYSPNPKPGLIPEPSRATQIVMVSGNDQTGLVGTALPEPFVVEVRDSNDQPVSGVEVQFEIVFGSGSLSNSQPLVTGFNGRATTTLTFGNTAETVTVTAASPGLDGSPVIFMATSVTDKQDNEPPKAPRNVRVLVEEE